MFGKKTIPRLVGIDIQKTASVTVPKKVTASNTASWS